MGSEPDHTHTHTPTKLSLLISRPTAPPDDLPPPPHHTAVSVPFQWEEAPGKPRHCHTQSDPNKNVSTTRTLELPPRLLFLESNKVSNLEAPSPTTVLDGPYVGRAMSFSSSYRTPRDYWNSNFGSTRWSGFRKINKDDSEGTFDFSTWTPHGATPDPDPDPDPDNKVNITRVPRRSSFLSLSHPKQKSHLWASIYESFKHMVPWRRRQEKQRKWTSKLDTV